MLQLLSLIAQIFYSPTFTTFTANPSYFSDAISSHCSASSPVSCRNTTGCDTCCMEYPGGVLSQTQFWDTDVPGSPAENWTIHGLWSDNCDGTWTQKCDPSRAHYDIRKLLTEHGATSTLDYIQQFWLNNAGTSEQLWNHEWEKHGTCYSTLKPSCLPEGSPEGYEAVAYFQTTARLFQTLPTYAWLAHAGITPSYNQTYCLSEILAALENGSGGYTPAVRCRHDRLEEVRWYYNLRGSLLDGEFIPINSPAGSTCPQTDIRYLPREV